MPIPSTPLAFLRKHWSFPVFFGVVIASDIGSRALDRFRSPCARHDTRGALSRTLVDRQAGFDLEVTSVRERDRVPERVVCSATFAFIRPGTQARASLPEVTYTVTQPDGVGAVDIPAEAWRRIVAAP